MSILIHQIYFNNAQLPQLEPTFQPYDNAANPALDEREYRVFIDNYRRGAHVDADYVGFVSWKFRQKTNMSGEQFMKFIAQNPRL